MMTLSGMTETLDRYDVFLLDQFGVLHNGQTPYAESIRALEVLQAAGKQVAIISNSGKRTSSNVRRMEAMGFAKGLYNELITSGEVAWHIMNAGTDAPVERCFLITSAGDSTPVDGLNLELVDDSGDADIVLISGTEGDRYSLQHYREQLSAGAARGVPCMCTNPDKVAMLPSGRCFGAGRIADLYTELGGQVRWIGKPYPEIYRFALARLADVDLSRVLCVGDSIEHDIAGAQALGVDSVLLLEGILAEKTTSELDAISETHGATARFSLDSFRP